MADPIDTRYTQDRELSWLRFDQRVLEEAGDPAVPLFERLKFAAIFTRNLDEFFMVRVGSLQDMARARAVHADRKSGLTPAGQLSAICRAVPALYARRDRVVARVERGLRDHGIRRMAVEELEGRDRRAAEQWFRRSLRPLLSPLVVDSRHPFPHLPSKVPVIALSLRRNGARRLGLVPIPRQLPPFLRLEGDGLRYLLTEEVVLFFAGDLFGRCQVEEKWIVSVTRSADISPEGGEYGAGEDFRAHMAKALKRRGRLAPVRLEVQGRPSEGLVEALCRRLDLPRERVFRSRVPLSMDYVRQLEGMLPPEGAALLLYPPFQPQWPGSLRPQEPVLPQILRRDALLFYPYQSMEPFLHLVQEAAADPEVLSIKIAIYRLASTSKLVRHLARAAEKGKEVTVLLELRARFDEENNIAWAQRLEAAGCTLLYGFEGFKVHAKICLITRRVGGHVQYITQIGTGNYNEKTARLYTDLCLMTAHPGIGADAAAFFQNMATSDLAGEYRYLLASPHSLKPRLLALIDREGEKARRGEPCGIFLKVNSVTDREVIDKLAQASQAGVPVTLNVRGICCLLPGVPGLTDRVQVFSIVGRFLEHPRIFAFGAGEEADLYIGSADLMTRNTQRRVELACPVLDPALRRRLWRIIALLRADNVKARRLGPGGTCAPIPRRPGEEAVDAQARLLGLALLDSREAPPPPPPRPRSPLGRLLARLRGE